MSVRSLPNKGQVGIYTTGPNSSSTGPTVVFDAKNPVVTDVNGVLGQTTYANLVPNNTTANFSDLSTNTAANNSPVMFVVRRFILEDKIDFETNTGRGRYNLQRTEAIPAGTTGFNGDTGMEVNK